MGGLHDLTGGEIRLGPEKIVKPHPEIAMIFQDANLLPWRSLAANIALPFELKRKPVDQKRIDMLLKRVNLWGFESKFPRELSGGMQQRVAIARALIMAPSMLFMDEPFGALDAFIRMNLQNQLLDVWRRTRKTMVLVTHDLTEALILGTRVVVLSPSPGRVHEVVDNTEWPEDRRSEEVRSSSAFLEKYKSLWETMIGLGAAGRDGEEGR
jgi:NitT/TauT family transport system ATP-binding protein